MSKRTVPTLLITDLDNTLYDWFNYFIPSFYAMIEAATEILGAEKQKILEEIREVHQKHHDVEHPFALLETPTAEQLMEKVSFAEAAATLDPAFYAFNKTRCRLLRTYPGVLDTLRFLKARGTCLVAYSESKKHAVMDRLLRLQLLEFFDRVYCRRSSPTRHPHPERAQELSATYPKERLVELQLEQRKPDPEVLLAICGREGIQPGNAVYVGDSLPKDILMANRAGIYSIWARYGEIHRRVGYEKLIEISHWTDEDVARERSLIKEASEARPDLVLKRGFVEIRRIFAEPAWARAWRAVKRLWSHTSALKRDVSAIGGPR